MMSICLTYDAACDYQYCGKWNYVYRKVRRQAHMEATMAWFIAADGTQLKEVERRAEDI